MSSNTTFYDAAKHRLNLAKFYTKQQAEYLERGMKQTAAANKAKRDTLAFHAALLEHFQDLVELQRGSDPEQKARHDVAMALFKEYMANPKAARKDIPKIENALKKLGYGPDGELLDSEIGGQTQKVLGVLSRSDKGSYEALTKLVTDAPFGTGLDDHLRLGDEFSDIWLSKALSLAGLPVIGPDATVDEIMKAARVDDQLGANELSALQDWLEPAIKNYQIRESKKAELLSQLAAATDVASNDPNAATVMAYAADVAARIHPKSAPLFDEFREYVENYSDGRVEAGLPALPGVGVEGFPPDFNGADYGLGGVAPEKDYAQAMHDLRHALKGAPEFHLWLNDRGIRLAEDAVPSPALASRYLWAASRGKTGRASKQYKGTGDRFKYTVKAGKKYDFGAKDHGGAPVYAFDTERKEYVTPEELQKLHDAELGGAPVVAAYVSDASRGEALSALSTLIPSEARVDFEQEMAAVLNDPKLGPGAQVLVDKAGVIQIVDRLGKVHASRTFEPGENLGLFKSFAAQPNIFRVAGTASALKTGRGGNQLESLDAEATVVAEGVGSYIPEKFSLTAEEPTETFIAEQARWRAGQSRDKFFTKAGEEFATKDLVSLEPVADGGDDDDDDESAFDKLRRKRRKAGVDRRAARRRRWLDDPADREVSKPTFDPAATVAAEPDAAVPAEPVAPVEPEVPEPSSGGGAGVQGSGSAPPERSPRRRQPSITLDDDGKVDVRAWLDKLDKTAADKPAAPNPPGWYPGMWDPEDELDWVSLPQEGYHTQ